MLNMKIKITTVAILSLIFFFHSLLQAQWWKTYPYHKEGTLIYFPRDEGYHPDYKPALGTEWWYVNMHLQGKKSGHSYSAMAAYFSYNFRIFNITDETEQDFHSFTNFGMMNVSEQCLDLKFFYFQNSERWYTRTDSLGELLPFQYHLTVGGDNYALDIDLDARKPPLIIGGDGLITVGTDDSYYYSQTRLAVTGKLTFNEKAEQVTGIAWIDHQYGPFFVSPGSEETYEWFSLQLDNGRDINMWNIFTGDNKIPRDDSHRIFTIYIDDQTQDTSSAFRLERLSFWQYSEGLYFSSGWHLVDERHKIDVIIKPLFAEQVVPFSEGNFWEGSCQVNGIVDGETVKGIAFAELLHIYETPMITVISPNGGEQWDGSQPITWRLENPDDGNPLQYDLFYQTASDSQYFPIAAGITDTTYCWDVSSLTPMDSLRIKVVGYSIDSTITGMDSSDGLFSIIPETGVQKQHDMNLDSYQLIQNYPNPFNARTRISYQLPESGNVHLAVYDISGRRVALLVNESQPRGYYEIEFHAEQLASGVYFYQMKVGKVHQSRKMILIR